ncbi:MAG: hypothetical protein II998_11765 [Clostridia bacterium]|nr:hypothetical protein [Clostridia bacterium]
MNVTRCQKCKTANDVGASNCIKCGANLGLYGALEFSDDEVKPLRDFDIRINQGEKENNSPTDASPQTQPWNNSYSANGNAGSNPQPFANNGFGGKKLSPAQIIAIAGVVLVVAIILIVIAIEGV